MQLKIWNGKQCMFVEGNLFLVIVLSYSGSLASTSWSSTQIQKGCGFKYGTHVVDICVVKVVLGSFHFIGDVGY
jgi:hypothetical protein